MRMLSVLKKYTVTLYLFLDFLGERENIMGRGGRIIMCYPNLLSEYVRDYNLPSSFLWAVNRTSGLFIHLEPIPYENNILMTDPFHRGTSYHYFNEMKF